MGVTFPPPVAGQPYSYPLPHPHPDAKPHPPRAPLTTDQQAKLDKLVSIFNADDFAVPNTLDELKLIHRIRAGPAKVSSAQLGLGLTRASQWLGPGRTEPSSLASFHLIMADRD